MTEADLQKIETALNIVLPDEYKATMLNYPFSHIANYEVTELSNNADEVIFTNEWLRTEGSHGDPWPQNLFCFGDDDSYKYNYFDLNRGDTAVFLITEERTTGRLDADSLSDWIEIYTEDFEELDAEIGADIKKREERKANKKWWQFWI